MNAALTYREKLQAFLLRAPTDRDEEAIHKKAWDTRGRTNTDKPNTAVLRSKLSPVDDYGSTKFILPDGTRLGHFEDTHSRATAQVGVDLYEAQAEGIIRYSGGHGAEVGAPITHEQADHLVDGAAYSGGTLLVDVWKNRVRESKAFDDRATSESVRAWVNGFFSRHTAPKVSLTHDEADAHRRAWDARVLNLARDEAEAHRKAWATRWANGEKRREAAAARASAPSADDKQAARNKRFDESYVTPQPSSETVSMVEKNNAAAWDKLRVGLYPELTPEEFHAKIDAHLQKLVSEAVPYIRVNGFVLDHVLKDGRFKSQHETNTSNGSLEPSYRDKTERGLFGNKYDCPTDCPIYGHLATPGHAFDWGSADGYGEIAVELHSQPRRTTAYFGDSLGTIHDETTQLARPVNKMDRLANAPHIYRDTDPTELRARDPLAWQTLEAGARQVSYVEAQYHGGVTVADIKHVTFQKSSSAYRRYSYTNEDDYDTPTHDTRQSAMFDKLDAAGIEWSIYDRSEQKVVDSSTARRARKAAKT